MAALHFANSSTDSLPNRSTWDGRVEKNSWPRNCSRNGCYTSRSVGYCNLSRPCCYCCRSRRVGCWKYLPATVPDYWTPSPGRHGLPHMHYSAQIRWQGLPCALAYAKHQPPGLCEQSLRDSAPRLEVSPLGLVHLPLPCSSLSSASAQYDSSVASRAETRQLHERTRD